MYRIVRCLERWPKRQRSWWSKSACGYDVKSEAMEFDTAGDAAQYATDVCLGTYAELYDPMKEIIDVEDENGRLSSEDGFIF